MASTSKDVAEPADISARPARADSAPDGTTPPADGVPVGNDTWPLSLSTVIMRACK